MWCVSDLGARVEIPAGIDETGRGYLDSASLVEGESWLDDAREYGFADKVEPTPRPYSLLTPVSAPRKDGLLEAFLEEAQRADPSVAQARQLMQLGGDGGLTTPEPAVALALAELVPEPAGGPDVLQVGPAEELLVRGKKTDHQKVSRPLPRDKNCRGSYR